MVDNISKIQQLLADSKFVEAQKEIETLLFLQKNSEEAGLIELYFESLRAQARLLPIDLHLTLIEKLLSTNVEQAQKWLNDLDKEKVVERERLMLAEIKLAELKGQTEHLYKLISHYQILRYENRRPIIPEFVQGVIHKFFQHDFQIQLQKLALDLMRMDLATAEKNIIELILSCFEKSSPKGTKEKLNALYEILRASEGIYHLEIYRNLCQFMANGLTEKKDLKKIIEMVIYMEDFRMQSLVLALLDREGLTEAATAYASEIRMHKNYSYVYFDKFFTHLKKYFFQKKSMASVQSKEEMPEIDLKVQTYKSAVLGSELGSEISDEEVLLSHVLKHQNYSSAELLDVAVGFVQSDFNYAGLKASVMAYEAATSDEAKLKAGYLKITCLLKIGDYRAALDESLRGLELSKTQNDVLSFMYSQAEAHLRLNEYPAAKKVLKRIISIDSSYRLAKERLEKLNAI